MLVLFGFLVVFAVTLYLLLVRAIRPHDVRFKRVCDGLSVLSQPLPGRVRVTFHTYDGLLGAFSETEHNAYLSPSDARTFLNRLARYNLLWGQMCIPGRLVPLVTLINYIAQRRSISRQEIEQAMRSPWDDAGEQPTNGAL
jgi:hypothetical protein